MDGIDSLDTGDLLETLCGNTQHHSSEMLTLAMSEQLLDFEITGRVLDRIDDTSPGLLNGGVINRRSVQSSEDGDCLGVTTFRS